MLPEAQLVLAALSVLVLISIIVALFGCVCGCRKTVPKNELMGLAGMVKLTNPDENVNFSSPPPVVQLNSVTVAADHIVAQAQEINKRPNAAASSATRSLPDLPVESQRLYETADAANGDTSSDLYATVEDNKTGVRGGGQKPELPRDSTIESSYDSPSQTDNSLSPYARVKREHPYDQVKQSEEHPYAQVRANGKAGPSHAPDLTLHQSASSSSVDRTDSPVAPPRTRKSISLSQSSLSSNIGVDIPAATAIAGGIPANQELPYMTPPLPLPASPPAHLPATAQTQQHFSGDSQDSSKGYTSISVREPLSNILSQVPRRQELIDSHYATVSDDSDEMYAAIEEPNQAVYTSGSETYAQIRPMAITVAATINHVPVRVESLQPPPPPPSSSSVATPKNHTRQESSSSACSSIANPSSPKPEKRQANSPLPRPPDPGAVDDMYAKVMKKRRSSHSLSSVDHDATPATHATPPGTHATPPGSHAWSGAGTAAYGYETVANHCGNDGGDVFCSGYETVAGEHDSLVPGYERVAGGRDENTSDLDPNYEELKPQSLTYARVNKKRKTSKVSNCEPDYASLSRRDSGYERVEGFDPNYESVCRDSDPNYESVERQDPPYEKVEASTSYEPVYRDNGVPEDMYSQVNKHRTVR